LKGCERKFCEIERQLNIAQEKGDKRKAAGLKKSLGNAKEHCTDDGLKDDLIREIEEAQKDITEYESDLKEAEEYGKTEKFLKYQAKIEEKKNKIKRLKEELPNLH
jgi:predicted phage-related endonuclease